MQVQPARVEAFLGNNNDVQAGHGLGGAQTETFAHHPLDAVTRDGVADFFADGHAKPPGRVRLRSRQDKEQESLAMVTAARLEAGREFPTRPEPVRRRKD